jgi:hypothetical protein
LEPIAIAIENDQQIPLPRLVDLALLKSHPRNYNSHPDDQLDHIIQSIKEHRVYRNIVAANDYTILAGHGVVKALKKMGRMQAPVVMLDIDPSSPAALKILTGDNEISHLSEKNDRLLSELLKEIKDSDIEGLLGTGYDEMMLANLVLVTRPESEIKDINEAAEWVGMPDYDEGEETLKVVVSFRNETDRESFIELLENPSLSGRNGKTWSLWWPPKQKDDLSSVRFES